MKVGDLGVMQPVGVYISVPFCKAKCTFCNFASDVFAWGRMDAYVARICREIASAEAHAASIAAVMPRAVDTLYFGGGTPSLLDPAHIRLIFDSLQTHFKVAPDAEITLECAPGQLADAALDEWLRQGMNRVSLGVQSFVDAEAAAVGRLHTRSMCLAEIDRLRAAGVANLNLDLIAGLPLQTAGSWQSSVDQAIATGVPHVSVYMLEIDEESRLGREALNQGQRYSAAQLPTDEQTADFYQAACDQLLSAGIAQYEISNFAHPGQESRHNLKYWQRDPYIGFGLDAHSMLRTETGAVRFANSDDLDTYLADPSNPFVTKRHDPEPDRVGKDAALEEALFLGLRLNTGISLAALCRNHGSSLVDKIRPAFAELGEAGLLSLVGDRIALTARGRLLSNEVFSRILISERLLLT